MGKQLNSRLRQDGTSLIEVMMAFLVLAGGLLSLLNYHGTTQKNLSDAKLQTEAVALAEAKLQELQSYLSAADTRLNDGTTQETLNSVLTNFSRSWTVSTDAGDAEHKTAAVTVSWTDRDNVQRSVLASSEIYHAAPSAGLESLLAVANAVDTGAGANVWGDSLPDPDVDPQEPVDTDPEDTGDETPDPIDEIDPDLPSRVIAISGRVDAGNGASLDSISVTGNSHAVTCTIGTSNYACVSVALPGGEKLTTSLTFNSRKTVCSPNGATYHFENLSVDVSSGHDVVIRNKSRDC